MKITIFDILQTKSAIFQEEGEQIYFMIEEAISKKKLPIEISFENIENCSTQFLNACIGKLYLSFQHTDIDANIVYTNLNASNLGLKIHDVIENAKHYESYNGLLNQAIAC